MILASNEIELGGLLSVHETASVLGSLSADVTRRPLHHSPEHPRCVFRMRVVGSPGVFALLVQLVERLHAPAGHKPNHDQNADAAAHRVWLHRGLEVEQVPRADAAKGLLALKLLLKVLAQLSKRCGALIPVSVDEVELRIGVHEAPAFEVDKGETVVAGDIV